MKKALRNTYDVFKPVRVAMSQGYFLYNRYSWNRMNHCAGKALARGYLKIKEKRANDCWILVPTNKGIDRACEQMQGHRSLKGS